MVVVSGPSLGTVKTAETTFVVDRARSVAAGLLGHDEERWRHTVGVAECAPGAGDQRCGR